MRLLRGDVGDSLIDIEVPEGTTAVYHAGRHWVAAEQFEDVWDEKERLARHLRAHDPKCKALPENGGHEWC